MSDEKLSSVWLKLALELAGEALKRVEERIRETEELGAEIRQATPEILRQAVPQVLDIAGKIEHYFKEQLAERGLDTIMIGKELGTFRVQPRCAPEVEFDRPIYFISDPFPGVLLLNRDTPPFWHIALSVFTRPKKAELVEPLASIVLDCLTKKIFFCDTHHSYESQITSQFNLGEVLEIKPNSTNNLASALLETYQINPQQTHPTIARFRQYLRGIKVILPNGSASGFCDVASGKADIYLAMNQSPSDIFPGLTIADKARCRISTFEGLPVKFYEKSAVLYNVACTANEALHSKVMQLLGLYELKDNPEIEEG